VAYLDTVVFDVFVNDVVETQGRGANSNPDFSDHSTETSLSVSSSSQELRAMYMNEKGLQEFLESLDYGVRSILLENLVPMAPSLFYPGFLKVRSFFCLFGLNHWYCNSKIFWLKTRASTQLLNIFRPYLLLCGGFNTSILQPLGRL